MKSIERYALERLHGLDEFLENADREADPRFRAFLKFTYMRCVLAVSAQPGAIEMDMNSVYALSKQLYSDRAELQAVLFGDDIADDW